MLSFFSQPRKTIFYHLLPTHFLIRTVAMMKMIIVSTLTLSLLCVSSVASIAATAENPRVVVIPLSTSGTTQTLVSASGEWSVAGLTLPAMILHDLIFYVGSLGGNASCGFTMNFVINQTESRTLRQFNMELYESVELHFEAGVHTNDLRFGTMTSGCIRNWSAFGYEAQ